MTCNHNKLLWSGLHEGTFLRVAAVGHQILPPLRPRLPTAFCCSPLAPPGISGFFPPPLEYPMPLSTHVPTPYIPSKLHPDGSLWPSELPMVSACLGWSMSSLPTISPEVAPRDICVWTTLATEPMGSPGHTFCPPCTILFSPCLELSLIQWRWPSSLP